LSIEFELAGQPLKIVGVEEKKFLDIFINFQYFGIRDLVKIQHKNEILILPPKDAKSKI
jgi:hypothetical protein